MRNIFIFFFLVTSLAASAQNTSVQLRFGSQLTTGSGGSNNYDGRFGYQFGVLINHYFSEEWGIVSGLSFDRRQTREIAAVTLTDAMGVPIGTANAIYTAHHLGFPILASFRPHQNVRLNFGPKAFYQVGGNIDLTVASSTDDSLFDNFDYGIHLEAGYKLRGLFIFLYYTPTFNEVIPDFSVKFSNTVGLSLGYTLDLK